MKIRRVPQRMCLGCREMKNKKELIRIVRTPEGEIELDNTGKKPGRGAYICPDLQCYSKAVKSKSIQKALEKSIPEEINEKIKDQLEKMFY